jgi:hypothetical protein
MYELDGHDRRHLKHLTSSVVPRPVQDPILYSPGLQVDVQGRHVIVSDVVFPGQLPDIYCPALQPAVHALHLTPVNAVEPSPPEQVASIYSPAAHLHR